MADIESYSPMSGRVIGEDRKIYNIVDLLQNIGGGSGSMRFHFGEGNPDPTLGQSGDVYLNTSNGDFYQNQNGTWNVIGNLKGPQGEQGTQGEQGPQGPAGADGKDGVSVTGASSDGTNIIFELSDGSTIEIPWPSQ